MLDNEQYCRGLTLIFRCCSVQQHQRLSGFELEVITACRSNHRHENQNLKSTLYGKKAEQSNSMTKLPPTDRIKSTTLRQSFYGPQIRTMQQLLLQGS